MFSALMTILVSIVVGSDGENASMWEGGASVIYAEVTAVERDQYGNYQVRLLPIATLTGKYDAAFDGERVVTVIVTPEVAPEASTINDVPKKGTKVLADVAKPMKGVTQCAIANGPVTYMPQNKGIIEVTGFDDPKVTETIENLRKLRGKHREEAEKRAAEEKKP